MAVSGINTESAARDLAISMQGIDYKEVVLIGHQPPQNLEQINSKIIFKACLPEELTSRDPANKDDYSKFIAYDLRKYVDADYALIVHNDALNELSLPFTDNDTGFYNEDGLICVYHREKLEETGIRFAPVPLASKFSLETDCSDSEPQPFGFHNNYKAKPLFFNILYQIKKILDSHQ